MNIAVNTNSAENNEPTALKNNPFRLTGGSFARGSAEDFCASQTNETLKKICAAELEYYRGYPEKAVRLTQEPDVKDEANGFAALYLIDALTAIPMGNIGEIKAVNMMLSAASEIEGISPDSKKTLEFSGLFFNILTHNRENISLPPMAVDAFAVPEELRPIAVYAFAHYLILTGDYGRAVGLAEGTLIAIYGKCPVAETYLSLITSIGYICRGEWAKAEYFFRNAWDAAKADKLYMPFAEHRTMLSGMLEKCLKREYPAEYKKIAELSADYHKNWVLIHNELTGDSTTDKLTVTEMNIAMLASKGLSNTEIGDFLNISVNSVRAHLRNIFEKLNVSNRKDLIKYIIK